MVLKGWREGVISRAVGIGGAVLLAVAILLGA